MAFPWIEISSTDQLHEIWEQETTTPILFFKHSTRCSISSMVLRSFERSWNQQLVVSCYFIDLIKNRDVSNLLATLSGVEHQSPQVVVVKNKSVIYSNSHGTIDAEVIEKTLVTHYV
jgi:bacillithiol system protein YtxJ